MTQDKKPRDPSSSRGMTRRGFMTSVGAGAVAVAASGRLHRSEAQAAETVEAGQMIPVSLRINGSDHRLLVEARWTLLYVLREHLGMTAAKAGCERGECGACTVLIDDAPRYACMTLALEAEGTEITTPEGLMQGEELGPVQQAFLEEDAFQCGYCTPGQTMAVEGLLRAVPDPSLEEIRRGVSGNLCRCGAYPHIFNAAQSAAQRKLGR